MTPIVTMFKSDWIKMRIPHSVQRLLLLFIVCSVAELRGSICPEIFADLTDGPTPAYIRRDLAPDVATLFNAAPYTWVQLSHANSRGPFYYQRGISGGLGIVQGEGVTEAIHLLRGKSNPYPVAISAAKTKGALEKDLEFNGNYSMPLMVRGHTEVGDLNRALVTDTLPVGHNVEQVGSFALIPPASDSAHHALLWSLDYLALFNYVQNAKIQIDPTGPGNRFHQEILNALKNILTVTNFPGSADAFLGDLVAKVRKGLTAKDEEHLQWKARLAAHQKSFNPFGKIFNEYEPKSIRPLERFNDETIVLKFAAPQIRASYSEAVGQGNTATAAEIAANVRLQLDQDLLFSQKFESGDVYATWITIGNDKKAETHRVYSAYDLKLRDGKPALSIALGFLRVPRGKETVLQLSSVRKISASRVDYYFSGRFDALERDGVRVNEVTALVVSNPSAGTAESPVISAKQTFEKFPDSDAQ